MSGCICFIAQSTNGGERSGKLFSEILPWLIVLAGLVLAGGVVIYLIRRTLKSDAGHSTTGGFTLQDLRELHAAGELSDEEFERAKAQMIGRAKAEPMRADRYRAPASGLNSSSEPDAGAEPGAGAGTDPGSGQ